MKIALLILNIKTEILAYDYRIWVINKYENKRF